LNVEQLSEKIAALYFFIFPLFFQQLTFSFQFIQYRPLSCVLIYMKKIEIIELPKIYDPRGCLTVAEESSHIPFEIKKVEWTHIGIIHSDAPMELEPCSMMLIALAGEITIQIMEEGTIRLTRPNQALILGETCKSSIIDSTKHSLLLTIHQK
jgi:hypothetical protein